MPERIQCYTDGSCLGNPGPGGYAYSFILNEKVVFEHQSGAVETTNNRMELSAVLDALSWIQTHLDLIPEKSVEVITDSKYVKKGITEWLKTWKEQEWKRQNGELKNVDLWKKVSCSLDELSWIKFTWTWVKGHSGDKWNDHVDNLAHQRALKYRAAFEKNLCLQRGLTTKQQETLDLAIKGRNLFVTGPGGCGKTFLIKHFVDTYGSSLRIGVTSTTGTSALHIKGTTIHSWAGIGIGKGSVGAMVTHIRKKKYLKTRWTETDVLIIDEISMLSPELFDKLNEIAKRIRKNEAPFGGIQVILSGDFLQLPCIDSDDFCFAADAWNETIQHVCCLDENLRQDKKSWQECLNEIRKGKLSEETIEVLRSRVKKKLTNKLGIEPTILYPLNVDVDHINSHYLELLTQESGDLREYPAENEIYNEKQSYKMEKFVRNCPAVQNLQLTIGCQVMLLWNLDFDAGLVNGSRGVVIKFIQDMPIVRFLNGVTRMIDYHVWELEENDQKLASIEQIPLKLAYALSIHKSQGCTLDYVITDLSDVFAHGQVYVALSRVRTLEGLSIEGLRISKIRAHPKAVEFYENCEKK